MVSTQVATELRSSPVGLGLESWQNPLPVDTNKMNTWIARMMALAAETKEGCRQFADSPFVTILSDSGTFRIHPQETLITFLPTTLKTVLAPAFLTAVMVTR
jgi:hypothetical protein